jgi:predicted double-glycine peptidase
MRGPRSAGLAAVVLASLVLAGCVAVDTSKPPVEKPLSYAEIRYANTVRQLFDFSCGAAAIATVLTHYWREPTPEIKVMEILRERYPDRDWKKLQETGFSFEDLIFAAERLGFKAQGARVSVEELVKVEGPVIVHLDKKRFQHFSVVRASKAGYVFLSDPIIGAVSMTQEEFARLYTGAALAIWKPGSGLPKDAPLGRPFPPIDPSLVIGGVLRPEAPPAFPNL